MAVLINMTGANASINDSCLSWKAKGIFNYLVGRKRRSTFKIDELINISKDSRRSVYSGVNELKAAKYLHSIQVRKGNLQTYLYLIFDSPQELSHEQMLSISGAFFNSSKPSKSLVRNPERCTSYTSIHKTILHCIKDIDKRSTPFSETVKRQEIKRLVNYWQKNIKTHREGTKVLLNGEKAITRKYKSLLLKNPDIKTKKKRRSSAYKQIRAAIKVYSELFKGPDAVLEKKWPWLVGLDNFFGFDVFNRDRLLKNLSGRRGLTAQMDSWYAECSRGFDHCAAKYQKKEKRFRAIASQIEKYSGSKSRTLDAAEVFYEFHKQVQGKLRLPNRLDESYPKRFLKYFFKFLDSNFKGNRKFKPYIMLNKDFMETDFKEYLKDMDWLR